jgi:hypothetical protein
MGSRKGSSNMASLRLIWNVSVEGGLFLDDYELSKLSISVYEDVYDVRLELQTSCVII